MKKLLAVSLLGVFLSFTAVAQSRYTNQKMQIGQQAPELAYASPEGKTVSLKQVNKGRFVLIDFWASWCRPCRMANPTLMKLYGELKDKKFKNAPNGFTVVGVSLDKQKENWVKAIEQDKLVYPYHMSDLQAWRSEAAAIYGVSFIPQSFLVGPDGKIIAKYDPSNDMSEHLLEDLKKYMQ